MDPNSSHQWWSRWTVTVVLPHRRSHDDPRFFKAIELEHARVLRKLFGSTGQARVTHVSEAGHTEKWVLDGRVEGHPVHDPLFRARYSDLMVQHYQRGFGPNATVSIETSLEAGDGQDGKPACQLVIMPSVVFGGA
jgi:hypothetical protein